MYIIAVKWRCEALMHALTSISSDDFRSCFITLMIEVTLPGPGVAISLQYDFKEYFRAHKLLLCFLEVKSFLLLAKIRLDRFVINQLC